MLCRGLACLHAAPVGRKLSAETPSAAPCTRVYRQITMPCRPTHKRQRRGRGGGEVMVVGSSEPKIEEISFDPFSELDFQIILEYILWYMNLPNIKYKGLIFDGFPNTLE